MLEAVCSNNFWQAAFAQKRKKKGKHKVNGQTCGHKRPHSLKTDIPKKIINIEQMLITCYPEHLLPKSYPKKKQIKRSRTKSDNWKPKLSLSDPVGTPSWSCLSQRAPSGEIHEAYVRDAPSLTGEWKGDENIQRRASQSRKIIKGGSKQMKQR